MKKLISIIIAVCFMFAVVAMAKGPSDTAIEKANDNASFKRDEKTGKCTNLSGQEITCPEKDKKDKKDKKNKKDKKDKDEDQDQEKKK
jgi:hypothetical protein